jgi:hypothetical protein
MSVRAGAIVRANRVTVLPVHLRDPPRIHGEPGGRPALLAEKPRRVLF